MSKAAKRREKERKQFEAQTKYAGMTKAQIAEAKRAERSTWTGLRPVRFEDKRNKKREKQERKELSAVLKDYCR